MIEGLPAALRLLLCAVPLCAVSLCAVPLCAVLLTASGGLGASAKGLSAGSTSAKSQDSESSEPSWPERLRDVTTAMAIFERGELTPEEVRSTLKRIGRPAAAWVKEAPTPLSAGRRGEADVVEKAAVFLVRYGGGWVRRDLVNGFLLRWMDWVEQDAASEGPFGQDRLWETVALLVNSQAALGDYEALISLIEEDGRFPLPKAPDKTKLYLLRTRASTFGSLGRFAEARQDLVRLSELLEPDGSIEDRFQEARAWFSFETLQGRLDQASGRLATIEELTATLKTTATPHRRQVLTGALWASRARFHLAADEYSVAAKVAEAGMNSLTHDFKRTLSGIRAMDSLRFFAFLAVRREARLGASNAPGDDDEDFLGGKATAIHLATASTLPQFNRTAVVMERSLSLSRSGRADEALAILDDLESQDPTQVPPLHRTSPLLAMRYASRRFEAARSVGDEALVSQSAEALRTTFQRWLECWRQVPRMPGGVGYLQHPERRRALHLVLDATLPAGAIASPRSAAAALDIALQADGCGTISARLGAPSATSRDLVSMAKEDNATFVILIPGTMGTHRFTVDGAGVKHRTLESASAFAERLSPVIRSLRSRPQPGGVWPPASLKPAVTWLSQRLAPKAATGPVYYAGLEALGIVPLEALQDREGDFLGLTRVVVRTPSAAGLIALRDDQKARQEKAGESLTESASMELFVAEGDAIDEITKAKLPRLSYSLSDYAALKDATQANIRFRRGASGTKVGLLETLRSGADLHVTFAHGGHPALPPFTPGLFLRPEPDAETLELTRSTMMGELEQGRRAAPRKDPVRVVLLAACGAGAGPLRRGDAGASDFSGALLAGRIPTVLVAQERVELTATKVLVVEFAARYLRDGASAGEALLSARRALASNPRTSHPHFWSPLQLHGWAGTRRNYDSR